MGSGEAPSSLEDLPRGEERNVEMADVADEMNDMCVVFTLFLTYILYILL